MTQLPVERAAPQDLWARSAPLEAKAETACRDPPGPPDPLDLRVCQESKETQETTAAPDPGETPDPVDHLVRLEALALMVGPEMTDLKEVTESPAAPVRPVSPDSPVLPDPKVSRGPSDPTAL